MLIVPSGFSFLTGGDTDSGQSLWVALRWLGEGQCCQREPLLFPSSVVCRGLCGAGAATASPPCARILSALSYPGIVTSYSREEV